MENGLLPSKHSAGRLTTAARAELLLAVTLGNEPVKPPDAGRGFPATEMTLQHAVRMPGMLHPAGQAASPLASLGWVLLAISVVV